MEVPVILVIEAKDEYEGGAGRLPASPQEAAQLASDVLRDSTRGDFEQPWMVRSVRVAI